MVSLKKQYVQAPFSSPKFVGFILLLWFVIVTNGCSCGIAIVQSPTSGQANDKGGNKANQALPPATQQTTQRPSRYQVRGVAMVAFYPSPTAATKPNIDFTTGSMNGYAIFYNKPQETVISAWAMKDGDCSFEASSYKDLQQDKDLRGLDGGKKLSVHVGRKTMVLEYRNTSSNPSSPNIIYNLPTLENYLFPYNRHVIFQSKGARELKAFQIELQAPARITVIQPKLHKSGITLSKKKDTKLQWSTAGSLEYLAVRFNQNLQEKKQVRSLFCRFANTGQAIIPGKQLAKLASDPEGKFTNIYILSTTYKLAKVPGFSDPILSVVRVTSTVPAKLD